MKLIMLKFFMSHNTTTSEMLGTARTQELDDMESRVENVILTESENIP